MKKYSKVIWWILGIIAFSFSTFIAYGLWGIRNSPDLNLITNDVRFLFGWLSGYLSAYALYLVGCAINSIVKTIKARKVKNEVKVV